MNLKQKLTEKQPKVIKDLHHKNFLFLFLCIYKMSQIRKEAYKKCEVEIVDYDNWAQMFDKCDPEKENYRYNLMPSTKF